MPWRAQDVSEIRLSFAQEVRTDGLPIAEAARRYGVSRRTAYKWLARFDREPAGPLLDRSRRPHHSPNRTPDEVVRRVVALHDEHRWGPRKIRDFLSSRGEPAPSPGTIANILRRCEHQTQTSDVGIRAGLAHEEKPAPAAGLPDGQWMLGVLQGRLLPAALAPEIGAIEALDELVATIAAGKLRDRNKAMSVLARCRGISASAVARFLGIGRVTVASYWDTYRLFGAARLFAGFYKHVKKSDDELLANTLFSVLHAPPSEFDINRTTWRMGDLKRVLAGKGFVVSLDVIRRIVRAAGYRWKDARVALTSTDPEYRQKLERLQAILSGLGPNERFFSIDEYGPFAVKMQGGRSLMPPGVVKSVPQRQRAKGTLIVTAALELSTNQVTHFYSQRKDTAEMLKLLEVLLVQYADCDKIYLSWDAASWHGSKKLNARVAEINSPEYRSGRRCPTVELVPLPACAQFLNVIESVFSGMAKAVIHNSDYESVESCKAAIDRYFAERNTYFKTNPRRAGRIIWGEEGMPSRFSPANNCKDPRYKYLS
jgi:transposase